MIVSNEEHIVEPGDIVHIPRNHAPRRTTIGGKSVFFVVKSPCGYGESERRRAGRPS